MEASLGYIVKSCLKTYKNKKGRDIVKNTAVFPVTWHSLLHDED